MATFSFILWLTILLVHGLLFLGALAQPLKRKRRSTPADDADLPAVSIILPVRGDRPNLSDCLSSLAQIDYPHVELILCVGDKQDPALPTVQAVVENASVPAKCLIGRADGFKNDKLRLVANGYANSRHPVILMTDDNMIWRGSILRDLVSRLEGDVGLVSGVTTATDANNLWGRVEQAMINGYFNKLMLVGDLLGISHVTGKILLFQRTNLDAAGGIDALNEGVCEDATLREKLEEIGLHAVLSPLSAEHPVPDWSPFTLWHRHLRWFRCRRAHGGFMFWLEPLISMAALVVWSVMWGLLDADVPAWTPLLAGLALWIGLEAGYLAFKKQPLRLWLLPSMLLRETLFPALWIQCLKRPSVDWRGNAFEMATGKTRAR